MCSHDGMYDPRAWLSNQSHTGTMPSSIVGSDGCTYKFASFMELIPWTEAFTELFGTRHVLLAYIQRALECPEDGSLAFVEVIDPEFKYIREDISPGSSNPKRTAVFTVAEDSDLELPLDGLDEIWRVYVRVDTHAEETADETSEQ